MAKECSEKFSEIKKSDLKCFVTAEVPLVYANRDGIEGFILNIINLMQLNIHQMVEKLIFILDLFIMMHI